MQGCSNQAYVKLVLLKRHASSRSRASEGDLLVRVEEMGRSSFRHDDTATFAGDIHRAQKRAENNSCPGQRSISASEAAGGARFELRVLCFHRDAKHAGRKVHATVCAAQHHDRKAGRLTAEQSDPCCKRTTSSSSSAPPTRLRAES